MNAQICEMIANQILESLENGVVPWAKPWIIQGGAKSHVTGKPYSILNQMTLTRFMKKTDDNGERSAASGEFVTFKQAQKEGGHVKKGAKSCPIVFWKVFAEGIKGDDGTIIETGKFIPYLQYYRVFHLSDVEGLTEKYPDPPLPDKARAIENAEAIWRGYCERENLEIKHESPNHAYYSVNGDYINIPDIKQFESTEGYYNTVFHELTHSTGAAKRLNRNMQGGKRSQAYSAEELVAEIGACSILSYLGILNEDQLAQNASYIDGWKSFIKEDKKAVILAAGRAQKAINMILGRKEEDETTQEAEAV